MTDKVIAFLASQDVDLDGDLQHYGVKGMKWGKSKFDTPGDYLDAATSGAGDGIAGGAENVIDEDDALLDSVSRVTDTWRSGSGKTHKSQKETHKRGKITKFLDGLFDKKTPYKKTITKDGRTATFKGTRTNQGTIGAFVDQALGRNKKKYPVTTYQVDSFTVKGSFDK